MSIAPAAGSKLYISSLPITDSCDTIGEFGALTWVQVGEVESLGEYGDEANIIPFASLNDARVRKQKGARDAGTMAVVCGADPYDAGQLLLLAAEASEFQYGFKVTMPDGLTALYNDSIEYFRGLVASKRLNIGSVDNVIRRSFNIGINSAIYAIPAAPIATT